MNTPAIILFFAIMWTFGAINTFIRKPDHKYVPIITRIICALLWSYLFHLLN